jgi:PAS domain S-box-containing protein
VRTSEERLRLLIDSAVDYAIYTMTQDGQINFWNAGAERMFGYTSDEILGRNASILFAPEDRAAGGLEQELARARASGRTLAERLHVRKDGSRFFCSGVTTRLGDDAVFGFARIARDLTAQRDAAEALERAHSGVEERVVQRTQDLQDEVARRATAQEHVTDLMHKLVTAQEEQRARIARDLHDQLGQQLTTLRLALERLRDRTSGGAADEDLRSALELVQRTDAEVDLLVWELRPAVLDDFGLAAALPRFVRDWSTHYGIPADVRIVPTTIGVVSRDVEVTYYRIAQEALNNIVKHAHATRADVLLELRDGSLVLVVEDDGIGFDPAAPERAQGIGLLGMRERAELVGATLEVESSPGNGTSIFLRVPVASESARPATRS